jgi:hypothetical protein
MIDADLAELYGVPTKRFSEQVRRNLERFPPDFMFQLTEPEWATLRSQFSTLKTGRGQHPKPGLPAGQGCLAPFLYRSCKNIRCNALRLLAPSADPLVRLFWQPPGKSAILFARK